MRAIRAAIGEGTLAARAAEWRQKAATEEEPAEPVEDSTGA